MGKITNKQATIKDVAKLANVSLATVSRVINGIGKVNEDSIIKVNNAIKKLGYSPNIAARSLVKKRTNTIGIVVNNLHDTFFHNLIKGFEYGALETHYNVIFCSVIGGNVDSKVSYIKYLANGVVDAVVLFGSYLTDEEMINYLSKAKIEFTLIENDIPELSCNRMLVDNKGGACKAVEYLYSIGHKDIAYIGGNPNKRVTLERLNGYFCAMHKYDLSIKDDYVQYTSDDPKSGYKAMQRIMNLENRPTAVFCYDDGVASLAIMAANDMGISVPEDVSIIGFDNRDILPEYYKGPSITTVEQPLYQIGYDSITMLAEKLSDANSTEYIYKVYDTKVVIKETCGKPRKEINKG